MKLFSKITGYLDEREFLSFRLWQFSLYNVHRFFPWFYLFKGLPAHPFQFGRGLLNYRRLVRHSGGGYLSGTASLDQLATLAKKKNRFLIAPGFCMKPYDYAQGRSTCPAGHFNHKCQVLSDISLLNNPARRPKPCSQCGIAPLAQRASEIGADVYIMTSAIDIARDVYIPALQNKGARVGLFFLCPYSLEPFTFGLATSGLRGFLVPFCQGACSTHQEWTNADIGIKNNQTFVASEEWQDVLELLEKLVAIRGDVKNQPFVFKNHVYRTIF